MSGASNDEEHPDLKKPGLCRVTVNNGNGIEWMCRLPVHAKIYRRRNGQVVYDNNPKADQHFFVNRYPYRNKE